MLSILLMRARGPSHGIAATTSYYCGASCDASVAPHQPYPCQRLCWMAGSSREPCATVEASSETQKKGRREAREWQWRLVSRHRGQRALDLQRSCTVRQWRHNCFIAWLDESLTFDIDCIVRHQHLDIASLGQQMVISSKIRTKETSS